MVVLPGLAARVAGLRHHVPAPQLLAVLDVERGDPASSAGVAGAVLNQDLADPHQRRSREFLLVAELVLRGNVLVPHDLAVVAIDGDRATVRQVGDDEVFPERDAARTRCVSLVRHARIGHPRKTPWPSLSVDLVMVPQPSDVYISRCRRAVDFVLRRFAQRPACRPARAPTSPQILEIVAVDLRQLGIAESSSRHSSAASSVARSPR